jgi:hypothetical protein
MICSIENNNGWSIHFGNEGNETTIEVNGPNGEFHCFYLSDEDFLHLLQIPGPHRDYP